MALELRVLDSSGNNDVAILPDWSNLTFSTDLTNPGALQFEYPTTGGRNAQYLTPRCTLRVLLDGYEPRGGRFKWDEGTGSLFVNGGTNTYACKSTMSQFGKLILGPTFSSQAADSQLFNWTSASAGYMGITAAGSGLNRMNQLGGSLDWLSYPLTGFTTSADSTGTAWPTTYTVNFETGTTVLDVINYMVDNNIAEPAMDGKVFKLYRTAYYDGSGTGTLVPSTNNRDRTSTVTPSGGVRPVIIQTGYDLLEATYQTSTTDQVNALLALGDNVIGQSGSTTSTSAAWVYDTARIAADGYIEGTIKITGAGATETTTLQKIATQYLTQRKIPRTSYTYSVSAQYTDTYRGKARPFVDYRVGDTITVLDSGSAGPRNMRILVMSATFPDRYSSSVALTMNDYFSERDVVLQRTLKRYGIS